MSRNSRHKFSLNCLLFIFSSILLFTTPVFSQTDPEAIIQQVLKTSESDDRKLFVLQFSSTGMTESAARAFSNMISRNLDNTSRFKIISLDAVEAEIQKQAPSLLPCFEIGCGIQIGKITNLDWVLSGHISLTPSGLFSLNVKLVHIFDNALAFEDTIRFSDNNMDRRFYELSNRITNNAPLTGYVITANNKIAVIDLGEQNGISVGDQVVIYRNKKLGDEEEAQSPIVRRHNIGILKITRVGKKVSEGVYFQTIETPKPGQRVTSYLDKRKQIQLIVEVRKELDTQQRTVYEIKKSVLLSPIQLEDISRKKWIIKVRQVTYEKEFWQLVLLSSGVVSAYFLSQFQSGDDLKLLTSLGVFSYSTFEYFTTRSRFKELMDEGRYKGYLELKIRPTMGDIGIGYRFSF
ncbi:MAG: hypothetical protein HQ517_01730 [SAR324 cluster bacterium]|nr:hypothetical protein [SAR324 cluster bacterium]